MTFYMDADMRRKAEHVAKLRHTFAKGPTEGIQTMWFEHVDEAKREEFAALLRNSNQILDVLKGILVKEFEKNLRLRSADYSKPNWALDRADSDGYMRAIQNYIDLLTITK